MFSIEVAYFVTFAFFSPCSEKTLVKPVILLFRLRAIRSVYVLYVCVFSETKGFNDIPDGLQKTQAKKQKNKIATANVSKKKILTFARSPDGFSPLHSPSPSDASSWYHNNGYNRCCCVRKRLWRLGEKNAYHLPP